MGDGAAGRGFRFRPLGEVEAGREVADGLHKWGLRDTFRIARFRFDSAFPPLCEGDFLAGLLGEPRAGEVLGAGTGAVEWLAKGCTALSSNFIDRFAAAGAVGRDGGLVETLPFFLGEQEICNRAQQLLCGAAPDEEEPPPAWPWREELIETLWAVFVLGGRCAQFETRVEPLRAACHHFYRELVDCRLRDGVCVLDSRFYLITRARGRDWSTDTRDLVAVVVNPALRTCHLLTTGEAP